VTLPDSAAVHDYLIGRAGTGHGRRHGLSWPARPSARHQARRAHPLHAKPTRHRGRSIEPSRRAPACLRRSIGRCNAPGRPPPGLPDPTLRIRLAIQAAKPAGESTSSEGSNPKPVLVDAPAPLCVRFEPSGVQTCAGRDQVGHPRDHIDRGPRPEAESRPQRSSRRDPKPTRAVSLLSMPRWSLHPRRDRRQSRNLTPWRWVTVAGSTPLTRSSKKSSIRPGTAMMSLRAGPWMTS